MSLPMKQIHHNYIDKSVYKWLDIHFGDTSFNGRVVLGCRRNGRMKTMTACSLKELRPYMKLIHASQRLDYYITANTVCGVKRRKEELFGLQNMVIDVDCHGEEQIHAIAPLLDAFIWRVKRDLWDTGAIPTPNSIVRTGRGVQLWWALQPCYGGRDYKPSFYHYNKIKNNLMDHIECLLEDYSEELGRLCVDRGTSSNAVGYFRIPCTYNTTARCFGSLEILHDKKFDQRELTLLESPEGKDSKQAEVRGTKYVPLQESDRFILSNFQTTGVRRVLQLIKLRNLRDNEVGSEMRDYFNFSVYNALRMTYLHDQAMIFLRKFNDGFKQPMTLDELDNCVSSAKDLGGYKYTNEKLIELLAITPSEQLAIGLFPALGKHRKWSRPNASRDEARKALREDRDNRVITMYENGTSQAEIARSLGLGKNTVGRIVKEYRSEGSENIETMNHEGDSNSRPYFGSIYVLNDSRSYERSLAAPVASLGLDDALGDGLFPIPKKNSS